MDSRELCKECQKNVENTFGTPLVWLCKACIEKLKAATSPRSY